VSTEIRKSQLAIKIVRFFYCPTLPETLGIFAQGLEDLYPSALGINTRGRGQICFIYQAILLLGRKKCPKRWLLSKISLFLSKICLV